MSRRKQSNPVRNDGLENDIDASSSVLQDTNSTSVDQKTISSFPFMSLVAPGSLLTCPLSLYPAARRQKMTKTEDATDDSVGASEYSPEARKSQNSLIHTCSSCGIKFSNRSTLEAHLTFYCTGKPVSQPAHIEVMPPEIELKKSKPLRQAAVTETTKVRSLEELSRSFCKECKIQFSSMTTYKGHKEYYCPNRQTIDENSNSSTAALGNNDSHALTSPTKDGLIERTSSESIVQSVIPIVISSPMSIFMPSPVFMKSSLPPVLPIVPSIAPKVEQDKPLDLSLPSVSQGPMKRNSSEDTSRESSKDGQDAAATLSSADALKRWEVPFVPPAVCKCHHCNIIFYKPENYIVHKKHYCPERDAEYSEGSRTVKQSTPEAHQASRDYFCCDACNIRFSSKDTLNAHRKFYCSSRLAAAHSSSDEEQVEANPVHQTNGKINHGVTYEAEASLLGCNKCGHIAPAETFIKITPGDIIAPPPLLTCPFCSFSTKTESLLVEHMKCHSPSKVYKCTICGYRGNTMRGMRMHGKLHVDAGEPFIDGSIVEMLEPALLPRRPADEDAELIRMKSEPYKHRTSHKGHKRLASLSPSYRSRPRLSCCECGDSFHDEILLQTHMLGHRLNAAKRKSPVSASESEGDSSRLEETTIKNEPDEMNSDNDNEISCS